MFAGFHDRGGGFSSRFRGPVRGIRGESAQPWWGTKKKMGRPKVTIPGRGRQESVRPRGSVRGKKAARSLIRDAQAIRRGSARGHLFTGGAFVRRLPGRRGGGGFGVDPCRAEGHVRRASVAGGGGGATGLSRGRHSLRAELPLALQRSTVPPPVRKPSRSLPHNLRFRGGRDFRAKTGHRPDSGE